MEPNTAPDWIDRTERGAQLTMSILFCILGALFLGYGMSVVFTKDSAPLPLYDFDETTEATYEGTGHNFALSGIAWRNHCQENPDFPAGQQWVEVESMFDLDLPVLLIPSICVATPVQTTNQNADGMLQLPDPPYATRYVNSGDFGAQRGTTVVASHVDYNYGENAPFSRLHKIEKGAPIVVVDTDGKQHHYTAEVNDIYEMRTLPDEVFAKDVSHRLNLVTCSGSTLTNEHGEQYYYYNLVVSAVPVDDSAS